LPGIHRLVEKAIGVKTEWVERPCPLCGRQADSPVFAEAALDLDKLDEFAFASRKLPEYMHTRLIECRQCGMVYGNPVLSPGTLASAYERAAFDSGSEAHYASATYAAQVGRILDRLPDRMGALDIGTGDGGFLEELLNLGFQDVAGVEPSSAPIASAKPTIRPLIRSGLFRAEAFPEAAFSLITCFQTMEHVWDPLETARGAWRLLKPGGALLIVVHNRKSVSARLLGMKSPIFDIEHLQLFCPATAGQLLERAGFRDVTVASLWNRYPVSYWMKLLPAPRGVKRWLLGLLSESGTGRIPVALPAGNLICLGFK
jgi:SAM-dependent methyltransferase